MLVSLLPSSIPIASPLSKFMGVSREWTISMVFV